MKAFSNDPDLPDVRRTGRRRDPGRFLNARSGRVWAGALTALVLGACGGGGGGDAPAAVAAVAPGALQSLGGVATYDFVPNGAGALDYASVAPRPIRGATVDVVGDGAVLATTRTDAGGAYAVTVPRGASVRVRVKAQMAQSTGGTTWDVSVRDNTQADALYAIETPVFQVDAGTAVRNVSAPSGWTGSAYGAPRAAAPFAILDTIYTTQAKVVSVAGATAFPPLRVFWSVSNRAANGSVAAGDIVSTAFVSGPTGAAIYVVGRENVDTDEYDASVIAHEWGHYYQSAFSRDDSPGGPHAAGNLLDRRVAFSEGWGNAWSGIALERPDYTDSFGTAQARGVRIVLGSAPSNGGWYREDSVQSIFWNLNRQVGFKPIHDAFTGPFRRGAAVTSMHAFAAAFGAAAPANAPLLAGLMGGQGIATSTGDPFGGTETNDGGVASALPLYRPVALGAATRVCVDYQAGIVNRLGNFAYLRFTAPAARAYTIAIGGGAGTDPDLAVWGSGVGLVAQARAVGTSDTLSATLPAGEAVVAVSDYNNTTGSPCFNVTIQ